MEDTARYIVLHSGRRFYPLDPDRWPLCNINDIAFPLGNLCRFTGHVDFYSVAEHSLLVLQIVQEAGGTKNEQKWALLHDAPEAVINDINSPLKSTIPLDGYREVEGAIMAHIAEEFGLEGSMPEIVEWADKEAFRHEVFHHFSEKAARNDFRLDPVLYRPEVIKVPRLHYPSIARFHFFREARKIGLC